MSEIPSFLDVMQKLDSGEEAAATEIFRRFSNRLIGLARSRLSPQMNRKLDPEDVVQSVFRSYFTRQSEGKFELADWGNLWGLLIRMTLWKCGRKVENLQAACRDVRREVNIKKETESQSDPWEAMTREPTPEETATLTETMDQLMNGLTETQQKTVSLKLQGYTNREISVEVSRSERAVYRMLTRVRERLEEVIA